jgi:hypothetical protein
MSDVNQSPFSLPSELAAADDAATVDRASPGRSSSPIERRPLRSGSGRHQLRPLTEMPADTEDNRLHIGREDFPDQFDLQCVTHSIFGQPQDHHRSRMEHRGWTAVYGDDFDGRYAGRFGGEPGKPIAVDGLVLMARSRAWSEQARREDQVRAGQAVAVKREAISSGSALAEQGVAFSTSHPSLRTVNRAKGTMERLQIPSGRDRGES